MSKMPKPESRKKSSEKYLLQPYLPSSQSVRSAPPSAIQIHSPTTSRINPTPLYSSNSSTKRLYPQQHNRNNSIPHPHPHSIRSAPSLLRPKTSDSANSRYDSPYTKDGSAAKFLSPDRAGTSSRPNTSQSTSKSSPRTLSYLSSPSVCPSSAFSSNQSISSVRPSSARSSNKSLKSRPKSPPSPELTIVIPETQPELHKSEGPYVVRYSRRGGLLNMNERVRALAVTITLALMVLIGIPMGAILPQKTVVQLPIDILVPLYVNPELGGWEKLYTSTIKTSNTNFTVIINPSNGPGNTTWPSGLYIDSIQRLSKAPNVRVIGYIDTQNGTRLNTTIYHEIETYAGWNKSKIAISGIFFDNTPARDWKREDGGGNFMMQEYMRNITDKVRKTGGFLGPSMVVHNPGKVPSVNLTAAATGANVTVVFEGSYDHMPGRADLKAELGPLNGTRENYACMVYDVPRNFKKTDVRKIVDGTRRRVEYLFITSKGGEKRYEEFSDAWEDFLEVVW